jgi:hypothetical protein
MDSDTPSPEPLVCFLFIHSCMSAGVPKKEPSYIHTGKKIRSPVHGAPYRRKAYIQWGAAWFPKGIVTTLLSLPPCHVAFGTMPSTLAWVDQSPISQHVLWQPPSGYTLQNCYCLPRDPGYSRVRIYDTPRYGQGVGFMGGTAALTCNLGTILRCLVSFCPGCAACTQERTQAPIQYKTWWASGLVWMFL